MPYLQTMDENPINLFYQDLGQGKPVIFIHGWPSSHKMWEYQLATLPQHFRCIAYDRRGFGQSDKPWTGYDYDTLAADLKAIIDTLNLQDVTLVGFSMGGGEVVRYLANYGSQRISKAVLVSSVTPFLLKTADNDGAPKEIFDEMVLKIGEDRPKFLAGFGKDFFGVTALKHPVSEEILQWAHALTLDATQKSTIDCVRAFSETDFRNACKTVTIPTLLIHGDNDKTVPIDISGKKAVALIKDAQLLIYEGAPHGLFVTEKDRLNRDLANFIGIDSAEELIITGENVLLGKHVETAA